MEDGPEWDLAIQEEAARVAVNLTKYQTEESEELRCIQKFRPDMILVMDEQPQIDVNFQPATEEEYKMFYIPRIKPQMKAARVMKHKAVLILKKEGKLEEIAEAQRKPASLHRPLTARQRDRWAKGQNPFLGQKEVAGLNKKRTSEDLRKGIMQEEDQCPSPKKGPVARPEAVVARLSPFILVS
jgi:hypothetical protein